MIPMAEVIKSHHKLADTVINKSFLNEYYIYANYMPSGENKVVLTFDEVFNKKSYFFTK